MMREVEHPSLLEIIEIYEGDNNIYCLGKLLEGDNLSVIINDKKNKIEEQVINNFCFKMLQALAYLEAKKIIHRDMKPENIVFEKKGSLMTPVLIDLGFATFEQDFRLLFSRCGTPGYVAPEVLNDKDYTCKADVFSLGVSSAPQLDYFIHDGN
jgi:serine/threonine protein kinase